MKKLLALVLALVMTLSLCVVSSNAAYNYGYMIKLEQVEDLSSDYAMVLNTGAGTTNAISSALTGTKQAKLVFADGTVKVVDTAKNYTALNNGTIVTYREDDGVYTLREVSTTGTAAKHYDDTDVAFKLTNGKAVITTDGDGGVTDLKANSASVVVIYNNTKKAGYISSRSENSRS